MYYFKVFIILALLTGCELIQADKHPEVIDGYEVSTVKEVERSQWESGTYYEASEESGLEVSSTAEVIELLESLKSAGITINEAWYVERNSSCPTPNHITLPVVVPASVVIKIEGEMKANTIGMFKPVEHSPDITCPYYVKHLRPLQQK